MHCEDAGARAILLSQCLPMHCSVLMCDGFSPQWPLGELWQKPFLQSFPEVCLVFPAYQRLWQRKMQSVSRSLFSYRIQNPSPDYFYEFLRWGSVFCKGQLMHFFPYWLYFVSIADVYCKPGTKKHTLLRLSGPNLKSSDFFHLFQTMRNL